MQNILLKNEGCGWGDVNTFCSVESLLRGAWKPDFSGAIFTTEEAQLEKRSIDLPTLGKQIHSASRIPPTLHHGSEPAMVITPQHREGVS